MGIDFYNCCICKEIYTDYSKYGYCEGCGKSWCGQCDKDMTVFWYEDHIRCDLCFSTDLKEITDNDIIEYLLKENKKTKEQVKSEMKKTLKKFSEPQNTYNCTEHCEEDECGGEKCDIVGDAYEDESKKQYSTSLRRGTCCVTRNPNNKEDWCNACSQKRIKTE